MSHKKSRSNYLLVVTTSLCALSYTLLGATGAYAEDLSTHTSQAVGASLNASIAVPVTMSEATQQILSDTGKLSITAIKASGDISVVTLRSIGSGVETSVKISSAAIQTSGAGVGWVLDKVVSTTGTLLVASGKALMFIPNELGQSLLHHSRSRD